MLCQLSYRGSLCSAGNTSKGPAGWRNRPRSRGSTEPDLLPRRRQGLLEGTWCLDENETLSLGQADEITRVSVTYPHLSEDKFVEEHRDEWLKG